MNAGYPTCSAPDERPGAEPTPTVSFPSGAVVPDWSEIPSPAARAALHAAFDVFIGRKWRGLDETDDRVRGAVLGLYAEMGKGPAPPEIAVAAGLARKQVVGSLQRLSERDLVVLDAEGRVVGAYPFSDSDTGHLIDLPTVSVAAMCAVDALGVGAMLAQDSAIRSSCRFCGESIHVGTRAGGRELAASSPHGALVWSGLLYGGACAATSLCTAQTFVCSDDHLERWRATGAAGSATGFRLSLEEALQIGRAIFGPMLAAPTVTGPAPGTDHRRLS
jgi:alkylmercury lyase